MTTAAGQQRMATAIMNFDSHGHLEVHALPPRGGATRCDAAGTDARHDRGAYAALTNRIDQCRFDDSDAERLAEDFIAQDTDRVASWTTITGIELYLRGWVLNRGVGGGPGIQPRALYRIEPAAWPNHERVAKLVRRRQPVHCTVRREFRLGLTLRASDRRVLATRGREHALHAGRGT
jgi:hypothetical protein